MSQESEALKNKASPTSSSLCNNLHRKQIQTPVKRICKRLARISDGKEASDYRPNLVRINKLYGCSNRVAFKHHLMQKKLKMVHSVISRRQPTGRVYDLEAEEETFNTITTVNQDMLLH